MSYDSPETLGGFAAKYGITYPLLADEGSPAIRALGILNEEAPEAIAGIPHPGTFVLNADGSIRGKHFYASYRERDTGSGVLHHLLGGDASPPAAVAAQAEVDGVTIQASFDHDSFSWGQRLWLTVELTIAEGLHVYGRPIPEGYFPLDVAIEPIERVIAGAADYPATKPFRVDGLDEAFEVYEGQARVSLPVTFMLVDGGPLDVAVAVSFQACASSECLMPQSVRLVLPVSERPLVERPSAPR